MIRSPERARTRRPHGRATAARCGAARRVPGGTPPAASAPSGRPPRPPPAPRTAQPPPGAAALPPVAPAPARAVCVHRRGLQRGKTHRHADTHTRQQATERETHLDAAIHDCQKWEHMRLKHAECSGRKQDLIQSKGLVVFQTTLDFLSRTFDFQDTTLDFRTIDT